MHSHGHQYKCTDLVIEKPGRLEFLVIPQNGSEPQKVDIFNFQDTAGVIMGMCNTDESIKGFVRSCFEYAVIKRNGLFI
ncbi:hypothetical protein AVEN_69102-1 [Araneus ventricosus]|uniref:Uncharacterized protein n=1 Tax=Araneus ventricosus TaxID=182803 RepID=A0A4Y2HLX3_ARAVE|nr:hypothetical protein AVEN_69102-1 [Araneus ventricosus]